MVADKDQNATMSSGNGPDRKTLCISSSTPGLTLHSGDEGFQSLTNSQYVAQYAHANEKLCQLKAKLSRLSPDEFWTAVMEGITEITGSQYALAVRRLLDGDHEGAVEMPGLGEPGQCLMATAFFYNDGSVIRDHIRDYKYYPYTGPCSHMKHDKVFIVPSDLARFIGDDQINRFAFPVDSYIGVPLFSPSGECIGHFGALWSEQGMKERELDWGFVEMTLHSLEDLVAGKLMEGQGFTERASLARDHVIPTAVLNAAHSLKPYARSLSHELRTPMQGVVGMLDIMHATVSEALEGPMQADLARTFRMLKENIEAVQDSSHRAVEAADNVVYAADLDMQVPETPDPPEHNERARKVLGDPVSAGSAPTRSLRNDRKRKLEDSNSPPAKYMALETHSIPPRPLTPRTAAVRSAVQESGRITGVDKPTAGTIPRSEIELVHSPVTNTTKTTRIRDHVRTVVNECLRYGGRPDSAIAEDTETGEIINVRSRDGKGNTSEKRVEWSVDQSVPDEIQVDERDFTKLVSVLLLNSLKFTMHGRIQISVHLGGTSRILFVNVLDTGTGIPQEFIPNLFKAFSRQDDTITRQSDGLGLGLLVAKSVARKLGGDLRCVRSNTEGANQGSEFELRVPLSPSEASSRQSSPGNTSTPFLDESHGPRGMLRSTSNRSRRDQYETSSNSPTLPKTPVIDRQDFDTISPAPTKLRSKDPTPSMKTDSLLRRGSVIRPLSLDFDRQLAQKHPLRFLVAEDNRLNRKLLVTMLKKLGYTTVHEAFDGAEAVRLMEGSLSSESNNGGRVDVILMDLWMPNMDGYEATRRILEMEKKSSLPESNESGLKILAVTADVTDGALDRAKEAGMAGFMTKPYKMIDLEKLIVENCASSA